jgi:RNA polymerase sigma-70 factor (ECF subfamily)
MSFAALTDAELIARVLVADDRDAFSELVRRHQSAVRATLRRLCGEHGLADDLAQETFLLAFRNLSGFRQEARFSTWLYRIATNVFLGHARRRHEEPVADTEAVTPQTLAPGPDAHSLATLRMDLERAMALLSDAERAAIVQCYHNDLSHEEAAYVLQCPVGTVKTHILRAKQKLKTRLAGWEPGTGGTR